MVNSVFKKSSRGDVKIQVLSVEANVKGEAWS